ncbi:MAG: S-layer homology domain-containing protein [Clostridia bacterium]|nr:S-layer homology domain-containing protein [Clostridia bacterium]
MKSGKMKSNKMTTKIFSLFIVLAVSATFAPQVLASGLQEALDSIKIEDIVPDKNAVSEDFVLPLESEDGTVSFSWSSDDDAALRIYGDNAVIVSNPAEREVKLTVNAVKGEESLEKSFSLKLSPAVYTGEYLINEDFEGLSEGTLPDDGKWARDSYYSEAQANVKQDGEWVSFMGATQQDGENVLRVYKKSGYSHASKIIHSVYAYFGEIDKDAELIVTADMRVDELTNDAMVPRLTISPGNTAGKAFMSFTGVKVGTGYQLDIAKQRMALTLGNWNSVALKARMSSTLSGGASFDSYYNNTSYKNLSSNNGAAYIQNMMFGIDTTVAKGVDLYVDNVKAFLNGAQQIADSLTYESIGATNEGNVLGNLDLENSIAGAKVSYYCSEEGVIAEDGSVTHPSALEGNKAVTLSIVVEKDGYKGFCQLPLSIIAHDELTNEFFNLDVATMLTQGESAAAVASSFTLLDKLNDEYTLSWESSDENVIKIENYYHATVIRNLNDMPVTLKVKMEKGGATFVRGFDLTVKKIEPEIDIDSIVGGNADGITDDFILPEETENGEPIQWESSDNNKLFIFDNKAYIFPGSEAKTVTLSAIGVFDGVPAKLDYELKINPIVVQNNILVDEDFEDIELGAIPDTKLENGNDMWVLDNSITANDPNQYNFVVEENKVLESEFLDEQNTNNKVLQAGKKTVDNTYAIVHLLLDAPMETVVNLEFDVFAQGPSHGHIWLCNNKAATLSGDILRLPMKTQSLIISDITGNAKRFDYAKNTWHNVKLKVDMANYKYDCYVDGKLEVENGSTKENGNIISRLTFGFGKGLAGYNLVDNVKVWVDIEESVDAFAKSIDLGDLTQVTGDLKLPALTPCGDAAITWLSTDPTVLNASGRVNRPASNEPDADVQLYALVQANNIRALKKFDVVVKSEINDENAVALDYKNLVLDTEGFLTNDLPLLKKGIYGSDILWESSNPEIIDPETGKVTLKQFDDMKITEVTLSAVVQKGTEKSEKKEFVFKVPERNYALNSTISGSTDRIDTPFANVADNNPDTSWGPSSTDDDKYIILTFPNATVASTKFNKTKVVGTFSNVSVYASNTTSGDTFTQIGSSQTLDINSAVEAKRVKFKFSGDNVDVSSIGIYYVADDNKLAEEDANSVNLGNTGNITTDISLPTIGPKNASVITWKSDKPSIISDEGKLVSRPSTRTLVKLTMTAKYGNTGTAVKTFNVYVAAKESSGGGGGGSSSGSFVSSNSSFVSYPTSASSGGMTSTTVKIYYNDIEDYTWAKEYIESFARKGVLSIPSNGKFEPTRAITRAEFLKILLLSMNVTAIEEKDIKFSDVSPENWYYDIVKRGVSCGIVSGISETEFLPNANISRQDIAVMVKRTLDYCYRSIAEGTTINFSDANEISQYAYRAVESLSAAGMIHGYENGAFAPRGLATRAEAVVLIGRAAK